METLPTTRSHLLSQNYACKPWKIASQSKIARSVQHLHIGGTFLRKRYGQSHCSYYVLAIPSPRPSDAQ
ncbi:hypothetical protein V5O48_017728, partial [Marasmius crinis-equi]